MFERGKALNFQIHLICLLIRMWGPFMQFRGPQKTSFGPLSFHFTSSGDTSCDNSLWVLIFFLPLLYYQPQALVSTACGGDEILSWTNTRFPFRACLLLLLPLSYSGPQTLPERSDLSVDVNVSQSASLFGNWMTI